MFTEMVAARPSREPTLLPSPRGEQRFTLYGVPWATYVHLREALDASHLHMTYLEGTLELMSPSPEHERIKSMTGRLIETFATERDIPLYAYGSTTFRHELEARGLEPDECYCVGADLERFPDLAIEIVITGGGIDKLAVYAGLGVREVWFWDDALQAFSVHTLHGAAYEPILASALLPGLDMPTLAQFVTRPDQPQAIKDFRDLLRAPPQL
jgi:Uma2 family endonuclease